MRMRKIRKHPRIQILKKSNIYKTDICVCFPAAEKLQGYKKSHCQSENPDGQWLFFTGNCVPAFDL